jgi:hypothetical protein
LVAGSGCFDRTTMTKSSVFSGAASQDVLPSGLSRNSSNGRPYSRFMAVQSVHLNIRSLGQAGQLGQGNSLPSHSVDLEGAYNDQSSNTGRTWWPIDTTQPFLMYTHIGTKLKPLEPV